jgi:hypothetical protein
MDPSEVYLASRLIHACNELDADPYANIDPALLSTGHQPKIDGEKVFEY